MLISGEKLLELNKKAKKQKFPKVLDAYHVRRLKLVNNYSWKKVKVIPCHFIDKAPVPRYLRVLIKPVPHRENKSLLSSAEIASVVALSDFAIDMAEQDYVDLFGTFNGED